MEIRQLIARISGKLAKSVKSKSRMNYDEACFEGYCPTAKEVENKDVKELADRLKARTEKETLTNVLEWQDRNMNFWIERHPIAELLKYFLVALLIGVLVIPCIITISRVLFVHIEAQMFCKSILIWLAAEVIGIIFCLGLIRRTYYRWSRKVPLKEGLKNTLAGSISIKALFDNRLGVCRDYAKLTACLVLNNISAAKIYFLKAPHHVATGILIEKRVYILDQRLPVLTIDNWKDYRHMKTKTKVLGIFNRKIMAKLEKTDLKWVDPTPFLSETRREIDVEKLVTMKVTGLFKIDKPRDSKSGLRLTIPWKNGEILYEDDELVNYSLFRMLEAKISEEMVETSQVTKIEAKRDGSDLMFFVSFEIE
jgi:predicted transglutaminase-like protease